jgi:hypothetical protein
MYRLSCGQYTGHSMKPLLRSTGTILGLIHAEYRQLHNRYFGKIERFEGDAKQICDQIIDRLWEGNFYRTSLGHFNFFWMRDFGTVAGSLVHLGHQEKVHHTLRWALQQYRRANTITLCIDHAGNTFNAPAKRSIDALPWLLHSLVVSNYALNKTEHAFLNRQLRKYVKAYLDKKTGALLHVRYAEMRDAVHYDRSAYSLALVARMARCAESLQLDAFPFHEQQYQADLMRNYWNGRYFKADSISDAYSSDSALMPFFLDVINDSHLVKKTCDYITAAGFNKLYPLQYGQNDRSFDHRIGMGAWTMPNYTGTTIWTWHGTFYLHILKRYKRPEYQEQYAKFAALIERHGTYPELVNPDGSWYYAPTYRADPGMVWAALFQEL